MTLPRIDTNIILRFITRDPPDQAARSARLFAALENGDEDVILEDVILAEVVWTLRSFFRMSKADIASALLQMLAADHIHSPSKDALRLALVIYDQRNIDFADALLAAKAVQSDNPIIYSFDRDFDRIPGVVRREP